MTTDSHHPLYELQGVRLRKATGLRLTPIWFQQELTYEGYPKPHVERVEVRPPPRLGVVMVVGIRLFSMPRDVVIVRVSARELELTHGPCDAAAYAVERPLPPLCSPPHTYRGDLLRFVAVEWGAISPDAPLVIEAQAYVEPDGTGYPAGYRPLLDGVIVVSPPTPEGAP